jgi:Kef-type K+ transport system membrane component KefB
VAHRFGCRKHGQEIEVNRRIFTLAAVSALVWLLVGMVEIGPSLTPAVSTFMLGFVLLSAALMGEIVEHVRLPRITGYIVAGIVFGPYVGSLLSPRVLEPLNIFNDMAYAFIGLAAGAELKLATLRGRWKSIVLLIACTTTVVMIGVGSFFFVGVIAAARSPSSAIAIIKETEADGPFAETILGVSVAMDVVVICLFSVALALAGLAFAPEQGMDLLFVFSLTGEIGVSIVLGVALGAVIALYLKHEGPQIPLVIAGLCFLVYRSSALFGHHLEEAYGVTVHLEPLLICAAAGFVIQNLSGHGPRLTDAMDRVALPVYVIFFTLAGARLHLGALLASWAVALTIAGCRVLMIMIGTRIATTLAGDPPEFRRHSWLGFVTQAGLSLALIAQIEGSFGAWGARLASTLVGVVAINQLIGPATFKIALEKVGEVKRRRTTWRSSA